MLGSVREGRETNLREGAFHTKFAGSADLAMEEGGATKLNFRYCQFT